jgi:imidazolonepropionase-like amidohydrolase
MMRDKDVGSITVGKYGDMIAVDGNPLKTVRVLETVAGVIKGGTLIR